MLIDTDVLIDVALDRTPHSGPSTEFLGLIEQSRRRSFVAWHTISNFHYIVARSSSSAFARQFILELTDFVEVAPTSAASVRYAASLPVSDFEDALKIAAARACGARHIVTRNVSDFRHSPIPAITPQEALDTLL